MTDPSDPAANIKHAAQDVSGFEERWSEMSSSRKHDEDAFNVMLLDIMGEAPSYEGDQHPDSSSDHRRQIIQEYLEMMPVMERIILVRHYGIWGEKVDPATTAETLNISRGQYDDYLVAAKADLKTRKNEIFKEIALDATST